MAKMAAAVVESGEDAFRKIFKCYRRKHPPPDFSDVIDFSTGKQSDKVSKAIHRPAAALGDATHQLLKSIFKSVATLSTSTDSQKLLSHEAE